MQTTVVELGYSKKTAAVRQAELLLSGMPALLAHLSQVVGHAVAAMLKAAGECDIVVELCAGGSSGQDCYGAAVIAASRFETPIPVHTHDARCCLQAAFGTLMLEAYSSCMQRCLAEMWAHLRSALAARRTCIGPTRLLSLCCQVGLSNQQLLGSLSMACASLGSRLDSWGAICGNAVLCSPTCHPFGAELLHSAPFRQLTSKLPSCLHPPPFLQYLTARLAELRILHCRRQR